MLEPSVSHLLSLPKLLRTRLSKDLMKNQNSSLMMAALCQACQNIPDTFFKHIGKSKPDVRDIRVLGPRASHWPIELILNSAREGCPLCKLFAANLDASFLPPEVRWYQPTIILRGLLDSHLAQSQQNLDAAGIGPNQSICVHSSIPDDLSFNDFFLIPPTWSKWILLIFITTL